jgi:hypothetical protein
MVNIMKHWAPEQPLKIVVLSLQNMTIENSYL